MVRWGGLEVYVREGFNNFCCCCCEEVLRRDNGSWALGRKVASRVGPV